jgi:low temperature requirement protein LtrA
MSELFTPPKFFQNVHFHRHTQRSVGWLELFYDLVYVATLIQIGNFLSDNLTWLGFGQFMVMMFVAWWAWTGATFFQNRYVVDDWLHRVMVFAQMFAVASLGLSVSEAFGDLYVQFTIAYVITRLILVLMYVRVWRLGLETPALARGYMTGFSLGIGIWLGSLLLPTEFHWLGWLVGIGVELIAPLTPKMRRLQRDVGIDIHHMSERFGIFTIIVLGESFVKVLDDAQGNAIGIRQLLFSTSGLLVLYSLWWLYFNDTAGKVVNFADKVKPVAWIYGHFPLAAGLVAFGVAAKKAFGETLNHPGDVIDYKYRLLYTASLVLYLVALAIIDYGLDDEKTAKTQRTQALIHLVCAVIIGILGLTLTGLIPTVFVTIMMVIMVGQVLYDIYETKQLDNAGEYAVEHEG